MRKFLLALLLAMPLLCSTSIYGQLSINIISKTDVLCNGDGNGEIQFQINGGTPPFEVQFNGISKTYSDRNISYQDLFAGPQIIQLTDANNNKAQEYIDISEPAEAILITEEIKIVECEFYTRSIDINTTGGTGRHTYEWYDAGYKPLPEFNDEDQDFLSAGTYELIVTDQNLCQVRKTYSLDKPTPLDISTSRPNFGTYEKKIVIDHIEGGTPPFKTYISKKYYMYPYPSDYKERYISPDDPQRDLYLVNDTQINPDQEELRTIYNVSPGYFNLYVEDADGCVYFPGGIKIDGPPKVDIQEHKNVSYHGGNDGEIKVLINGDFYPYTVKWNGPNNFTSQERHINNLIAGDYRLILKEPDGTEYWQKSIRISEPSPITVTTDVVRNILCRYDNTGVIEVSVSGGTPPYTYNWTGPGGFTSTEEDIYILTAGEYDLLVRDANGCVYSHPTIILTEPTDIYASVERVQNASCNGAANGEIDITVSGGTPPYTYEWTGPGGFTSAREDINNLPVGRYDILVEDAYGCRFWPNYVEITEPYPLSADLSHKNVSTTGAADGEIHFSNPQGGYGSYQYSINGINWEDNPSFTGLSAGTYSVYIGDAHNFCNIFLNDIEITEPAATSLSAHINSINSIQGKNTGEIHIENVSGGSGEYQYSIDNAKSWHEENSFKNLSAGSYAVLVRDKNDHSLQLTVNANLIIKAIPPVTINSLLVDDNIQCHGESSGSIQINASGGENKLEYSIDNGSKFQLSNLFNKLPAGEYYIIVREHLNPENNASEKTTITHPDPINASESYTNVSCNGAANGEIDITVSGGTPPYTYNWTSSNGFTSTEEDISALPAGDYDLLVRDANGCVYSHPTIILTEPTDIYATIAVKTNISCNGAANGLIDITVSGGIPPYTYEWTGPGGFTSTEEDITNIMAGHYHVLVEDANGCNVELYFLEITEPDPLSADLSHKNVSIKGAADGEIHFSNPQGGSGSYQYSINGINWEDNPSFTGLSAGIYSVYIGDAHNFCNIFLNDIEITEPASSPLSASVNCINTQSTADGQIHVSDVTGGSGQYEYAIEASMLLKRGSSLSWQRSNIFTSLAAGTYKVYIRDAKQNSNTIELPAHAHIYREGDIQQANRNTEFWFVAPEVTKDHYKEKYVDGIFYKDGGEPALIRVTTGNYPAVITLNLPAYEELGQFAPVSISLEANETHTWNLSAAAPNGLGIHHLIENTPHLVHTGWEADKDGINNKGIHITSTSPITAYYEVRTRNNCDIFSLKGDHALGSEFYVPFQNTGRNMADRYPVRGNSAIDVVATEDNTEITFIPTADVYFNGKNSPAGKAVTVVLNRAQTFSLLPALAADGWYAREPEDHLGGTYISVKDNKKIAVTKKDDSVQNPGGGCYDLLGDQLVPVSFLGTEYLAIKGYMNGTIEKVFIVATSNGTSVDVNGVSEAILNAGETFTYTLSSEYAYIKASKKIIVLHMSGFGCEVGAAILPSLDPNNGSYQIPFTRSTNEGFFFYLMVKKGAEANFVINGETQTADNPKAIFNAGNFKACPNNSNWSYARIGPVRNSDIAVGTASFIKNNKDIFQLGIINGGSSSGCRYAYFSNFSNIPDIAPVIAELRSSNEQAGQANGSISIINARGGSNEYQYSIDGGKSWQDKGEYTGLSAGVYNVQLRDKNNTADVYVLDPKLEISATNIEWGITSAGEDFSVCGNNGRFDANTPEFGTGTWRIHEGHASIFSKNDPKSVFINLSTGENRFIWEVVYNGLISRDTVKVTNESPSNVQAGDDFTSCTSETQLKAVQPAVGTGSWSVISGSATFEDVNDPKTKIKLGAKNNTLRWTVSYKECSVYQDVNIHNKNLWVETSGDQSICETSTDVLGFTNASNSYWLCNNNSVQIASPQDVQTKLSNLPVGKTQLVLKAIDGSCRLSDTLYIDRGAKPAMQSVSNGQEFCEGDIVNIDLNSSEENVIYTLKEGQLTIEEKMGTSSKLSFTDIKEGSYKVEARYSESHCIQVLKDNIHMLSLPSPIFSIIDKHEICERDSVELTADNTELDYFWTTKKEFFPDEDFNFKFAPKTSQYVYVEAINEYACTKKDSSYILVHDLPQLNTSGDQNICKGEELTITANGAISYNWKNTSSNGNSVTVSPNVTTWYYVEGTNEHCRLLDSILISVHESPVVDLGKDTTIHENQSILLKVGDHASYDWSTGESTSSILFNGSAGVGTHKVWVEASNIYLCTGSDTIYIKVDEASGISELTSNTEVKLYPIPADQELLIESDLFLENEIEIEITNSSGLIVMRQKAQKGEIKQKLQTGHLQEGLYLISLKSHNSQQSFKVIIKH